VDKKQKLSDKIQPSDADVIVICKEGNFYSALSRLNERADITSQVITRKTDL